MLPGAAGHCSCSCHPSVDGDQGVLFAGHFHLYEFICINVPTRVYISIKFSVKISKVVQLSNRFILQFATKMKNEKKGAKDL